MHTYIRDFSFCLASIRLIIRRERLGDAFARISAHAPPFAGRPRVTNSRTQSQVEARGSHRRLLRRRQSHGGRERARPRARPEPFPNSSPRVFEIAFSRVILREVYIAYIAHILRIAQHEIRSKREYPSLASAMIAIFVLGARNRLFRIFFFSIETAR